MKVIYLCAGEDVIRVRGVTVIYNDKYIRRDLTCDMSEVDLSKFDLILASPPCNYWTKANSKRESSDYAIETKHLLIDCIEICKKINIPMIVENVKNASLFNKEINKGSLYVEYTNRHTFWSNVDIKDIVTKFIDEPIRNKAKRFRQGGREVTETFENFIKEYIPND